MTRPWGWMVQLFSSPRLWIKLIRVYTRTSLQYHYDRSELHLWLFGCKYIRPLQHHRMYRGWYLEIAWGLPQEEDIVRLEDDYGRV